MLVARIGLFSADIAVLMALNMTVSWQGICSNTQQQRFDMQESKEVPRIVRKTASRSPSPVVIIINTHLNVFMQSSLDSSCNFLRLYLKQRYG